MFKKNIVLGYMHMSLAFGWFMLIVIGNLETRLYNTSVISPPYYPIFFDFFEPIKHKLPFEEVFTFLMDFFLVLVLSGVLLAFIKRFYSAFFGMKKISTMMYVDKLALYALWFVFPLRLFAESVTSGLYDTGGFLTNTLGHFLYGLGDISPFEYPLWWAYSISLGLFFVTLPFSRYMHIPAEVLLIFARKYGIKTVRKYSAFTEIELHSCSKCGVCLDSCQLLTVAQIKDVQPPYFYSALRNRILSDRLLLNCSNCGRCKEACPVGIDTTELRIAKRAEISDVFNDSFDYLTPKKAPKTKVLYFAGCMTHLTPAIKKSMLGILDNSGIDYYFMDEEDGVCCGRPFVMAGQHDAARRLIRHNKRIINESGAHTIVLSCPICLKVFKEDYNVNIRVMHHSQFILELINRNHIKVKNTDMQVVYHDPCELGRGLSVYDEPREVINKVAGLIPLEHEREDALCCGGSIANIDIKYHQRAKIQEAAVSSMIVGNPDVIVTACPLCKKTLNRTNKVAIKDIAEIVAPALLQSEPKKILKKIINSIEI